MIDVTSVIALLRLWHALVAIDSNELSQTVPVLDWPQQPLLRSDSTSFKTKQPCLNIASSYIVGGEDHCFLDSDKLHDVGIELGAALLEPTGRNIAPALTLPPWLTWRMVAIPSCS